MKATGIVRRIDELGRVVIPKEIRRTLRIREGDPLEIFTDREGEVILKKYSPIGELGDFAKEYAEALHQALGHIAVICDKDNVVAASGSGKRDLLDKSISEGVERLMQNREKSIVFGDSSTSPMSITAEENDGSKYTAQVIDDLCFWGFNVIICPYGDRYGCCTSTCFCIPSCSRLCPLLSL